MGIGPVPAVERLFARTGLDWRDVGLIELNEAFAPQVLAVLKEWGWSEGDSRLDILNVNGSGISLGHPIGVTGVRIAATMLNEMRRRDVRYGLETMCIGGGQGLAAIFERLSRNGGACADRSARPLPAFGRLSIRRAPFRALVVPYV